MAMAFSRRRLRRVLLAMTLCAAGIAVAPGAWAADRAGELQAAGQNRNFSVHIPDGAPPAGGFPLVLAFHGGGQQAAAMRRLTNLDAVADLRRFIAVYPDGIDRHWNDGRSTIKNPQDDIGFVSVLIDQLQRSYPIDRARIYATGLSNGALFAQRLGCNLSDRIAAIAPVAGTLPADIATTCRPTRPIAVLQIGGTADPIMPFEGGNVADFGGIGEGGTVLSVADTAAFWARHNGCSAPGAALPMPPTAPGDPTRIVSTTYGGCVPAGSVKLLTVIGGGHTWPGGLQRPRPALTGRKSDQIDATGAIIDFFLALPPR